jgi:hypothetical protein
MDWKINYVFDEQSNDRHNATFEVLTGVKCIYFGLQFNCIYVQWNTMLLLKHVRQGAKESHIIAVREWSYSMQTIWTVS